MQDDVKELTEKLERIAESFPMSFGPTLSQAASKLRELSERGEWVSVEDRLPEKDQRVILYCQHQYYEGGVIDRFIDTGYWTDFNGGGFVRNSVGTPTHWQPLPSTPKECR